jgi:antitoxin (DNA-binding transcriptional repressor) of toxin-antitoxin stability system
MTTEIDITGAVGEFARLIEAVRYGSDVILVEMGKRVVRLVPALPDRIPGRLKGKVWIAPDFEFTEEEIAEFERWDEDP